MRCDHLIFAVDTHTGGAPTRIVYDPGILRVPGATMAEKREAIRRDYEFIRRALMREPRGYSEMTGALVTHPATPGADFGLIFTENAGYLDLCGHAVVGAATAAFELGWVARRDPRIVFDTVVGQIPVRVKCQDGKVTEATMESVASYAYGEVVLEVEGKRIRADIAYSGNVFALVDAADFDLPATGDHAHAWARVGMDLKSRLNQSEALRALTAGRPVEIVEFNAPPTLPGAHFKSIVVFGRAQVDREPCATGTCAKMAVLFQKGTLQPGDRFVQESIMGTLASATVVGITEASGRKAILPEVTYQVFLTGLHQFLIDDSDPLKEGYQLS